MVTSLNELTDRLREIQRRGYVKSIRKGPTGVGHTLEQLLELEENNFTDPDYGEIELKAHRSDLSSLITLFTFDRGAWITSQLAAIERYGIRVDSERINLYSTLTLTENNRGLYTYPDESSVMILDELGNIVASWSYESLRRRIGQKIRELVLVLAKVKKLNNAEYFHYFTASFHFGELIDWNLKELFENGKLLIDLRLHSKAGKIRNHGTGFRIHEQNLPDLYRFHMNLEI